MDVFNKNKIKIILDDEKKIILRSATIYDNENLLKWKNSDRMYFFFKDEIDQDMQRRWFENYSSREFDIMTIVEVDSIAIGCMAIRIIGDKWDIYNVILGEKLFGGKGFMGIAFQELLKLGLSIKNNQISLKVLKHNPAVSWYIKQGFLVREEHEEYYYLIFNI